MMSQSHPAEEKDMLLSDKANPNSVPAHHARMMDQAASRRNYSAPPMLPKPEPKPAVMVDIKGHVTRMPDEPSHGQYIIEMAPRDGGPKKIVFLKDHAEACVAKARDSFLIHKDSYGPYFGDIVTIC
jgi:hypothetical protein